MKKLSNVANLEAAVAAVSLIDGQGQVNVKDEFTQLLFPNDILDLDMELGVVEMLWRHNPRLWAVVHCYG